MMAVAGTHVDSSVHPFRWTREEYHRLGELGFFEYKRVELIEGEILEMSPQKRAHVTTLHLVMTKLSAIFRDVAFIQIRSPISLGTASEPEPDIAVIPGSIRDYKDHPSMALLIIEVADTSLENDRIVKGSLYAAHGIADYWIVNLPERRLEVYRRPIEDPNARFGWRYEERVSLSASDAIRPLALTQGDIQVADLFP